MCPMPHYFVTMDIEPANPALLPVDKLASIVRAAILPTVEALVPLSAQGMLVTGGYLVGGEVHDVRFRSRVGGRGT